MFVDIKEFKSPLAIENILRPYKRGEAKITPEVCVSVLEATNYKRNLRDMLNCVLALPAEEQAGFKEVILSVFDNREQPSEILVLGKKLAVAGGYEKELGAVAGKIEEGSYLKSAANVDRWSVTKRKDLHDVDLSAYDKVIFAGEEVDFREAKNLPKNMDVSRCNKVDLMFCNLADVKELKFKDGAEVDLSGAVNLPKELDVSMCGEITMFESSFSNVEVLRFKNKEQMKNSCADLRDDEMGKVIFADDEKREAQNTYGAAKGREER